MSLDLEACCTGSLISLVICHQDADIGEMIDWMYIPLACRWTAFGDVGLEDTHLQCWHTWDRWDSLGQLVCNVFGYRVLCLYVLPDELPIDSVYISTICATTSLFNHPGHFVRPSSYCTGCPATFLLPICGQSSSRCSIFFPQHCKFVLVLFRIPLEADMSEKASHFAESRAHVTGCCKFTTCSTS